MSIQGTPTSGIRWIVDSTGAIVGYRNPVSDQDAVVTPVASYTAAQLAALAAAGGLTPFATYVASDTGTRSYATSASVLTVDPPGAAADITGTGTVSAPALVVSTGFSNTVAAAMEAFSAALPKDVQWSDPRVPEQGVIELGNGAWTLERTLNLDLSGASVSRYGLTIRGQGRASTILKTANTAAPANFKGGDGIWRLASFANDADNKNQHLRIEGISFVSYATQNGDGSTPLSDPARWVDLKSCLLPTLRDLRIYHRYPSVLSLNQYGLSLDSCYYANVHNVLSGTFNSTDLKENISGVLKARKGGVAFRFNNNNALVGSGLWGLGCNLAFHIIDENGLTLHGGAIEDANKGFLFDGDSSGCRVFGYRHESKLTTLSVESADEMYFARFGENTSNNYVEQYLPGASIGGSIQDYSVTKSNAVFVPKELRSRSAVNLLSGVSWTNSAGITTAAGAEWPSHLDPSITSSVQVTSTGGSNQERYSAAVKVNPDAGSVLFRAFVKRVSGAGMFNFQLQSITGVTGSNIYASQPQDPTLLWRSANDPLPVSSGAFASGKLTMVSPRPHGLQAGLWVTNKVAWGSLAINSDMYVESCPTPTSFVLIAAGGGTISDPGTITYPTTAKQMNGEWNFAPDITADWVEMKSNIAIRMMVETAPSLDGSNKLILPIGLNLLRLQTGAKIRLAGFADARLNGLTYTVLAGDVSGSNLTLSGASAMAGLDASPTSKGLATVSYGYIGLTEIAAGLRCITTNTGQNIVWLVAGEMIRQGYANEVVV